MCCDQMTGSPLRRPFDHPKDALVLPVALYIPNLICYARIVLSVYALYAAVLSVSPDYTASRGSTPNRPSEGSGPAWLPLLGTALGWRSETSKQAWEWVTNAGRSIFRGNDVGIMLEVSRVWVLSLYMVAALLDVLDGYVARKLSQASRLGAVLDVVADNVLRSSMWLASVAACPQQQRLLMPMALIFTSIEWTTFFATQLTAMADAGRYWKRCRQRDPEFVLHYFRDDFRNPLGALGIAGLFLCPILPFAASTFPEVLVQAPWLVYLGWVLVLGRLISLVVELYFIVEWVNWMTVENQEDNHHD